MSESEMKTEFQTILLDPPWWEKGGGKIKRGADKHYQLLKTVDMPRVIFEAGVFCPAKNCHMWLWVTNNFLKDGLWLMDSLGFRYISNAVWTKDRIGLGQYLRGQHELLLFGVCGRLPALGRSSSTWIGQGAIKKTGHSVKPLQAYELIEAISPGPRVELFARSSRPGWHTWGKHQNMLL